MTDVKIENSEQVEGLSLSFCVSDILHGKVSENQVTKIVASTNAPTAKNFENLLESYADTYWHENPEEGKSIARRFWEAGKIDQPRTRGEEPNWVGDGHWQKPGTTEHFRIT